VYELRIQHDRLNAYRVIKGETKQDVAARAAAQEAVWDERWRRKQELEESRAVKQQQRNILLHGTSQARELTAEAQAAARALESLLIDGCAEPALQWEELKDRSSFNSPQPTAPRSVHPPAKPSWEVYKPQLTLAEKLIPSKKAKKVQIAKIEYASVVASWASRTIEIKTSVEKAEAHYRASLEDWSRQREEFASNQLAQHTFIDSLQASYRSGEKSSVEYLASEALHRSTFPDSFPAGFDLSFDPEAKVMVVDYELPNQEVLPKHREVKYIASRRELQYVPVTETSRKSTYDKVLYQMALRVIHRLLSTDTAAAIYSVVFNGWVRSIDPATGSEAHGCILSVQAGRDEFMCLDLRRVDPKACFKSLKGVASSKLIDLTPIRPILKVNKDDARFIEAYGVVDTIDERTNLAAMDWQDFENLIREVFEKEFSRNGGEVKITRASRDGGVDAVAFDPDPLRGGKIVIQAKRYTNTVGVSAVRDLYGTVQHEGAMKGILVTTATFGSDAYEFARDKPITLISGAELLGILERHGHSAKINLAEARALL
jgi:restriction system protein